MEQNGGSFYTHTESEILIDPFVSPSVMQNQLAYEISRCEDLVRRDFRYAHLVGGASKMPMNMIWVGRNQGGDVSDSDLATLKDVAWNEFVIKRFLPSVKEGTPVSEAAASMLEIVRSMNLQRRRFQIMGLHEQVEASELQFVIHLCQAGLLHTNEYRITANRFRRHDKFFEAFALAVGAFVCASAPFTLGVVTTQYNRDLQYEYKKQTIALFVYVLQQNRGLLVKDLGLDDDYVCRIARLIVVSQDTGVVEKREDCDKRDESMRSTVESVQRQADRVERLAGQVDRDLAALRDEGGRRGRGRGDETAIEAMIDRKVKDMHSRNAAIVDTLKAENETMRRRWADYERGIDSKQVEMESRFDKLTKEKIDALDSSFIAMRYEMQKESKSFDQLVSTQKNEIMHMQLKLDTGILQSKTKQHELSEILAKEISDLKEAASKAHAMQSARLESKLSEFKVQAMSTGIQQPNILTEGQWNTIQASVNALVVNKVASSGIQQQPVDLANPQFLAAIRASIGSFVDTEWGKSMAGVRKNIEDILDSTLEPKLEKLLGELIPKLGNLVKVAENDIPALTHAVQHLNESTTQLTREQQKLGKNCETLTQSFGAQVQYASASYVQGIQSQVNEQAKNIVEMQDDMVEIKSSIEAIEHDIEYSAGPRTQPTERIQVQPDQTDIRRVANEVFMQNIREQETTTIIANAVAGDISFKRQVETMQRQVMLHNPSELETRVKKLEEYCTAHTNMEPRFNVFSEGQTLPAGGQY